MISKHILMIDDDEGNYHSIKNFAGNAGFILHYSNNLLDGLDLIKKNKKILGVILDGKGFINPGQVKGSDSQSFVVKALTELALIEREEDRFMPKCVYTAWYDQLIGSLEGLVKVFDKNRLGLNSQGLDELFDYLTFEIGKTDEYRIRTKFQNVFNAVEKSNSPLVNDSFFISALSLLDDDKIEKTHFNNLRDLLERFFISLNKVNKELLPDQLFKNPLEPNLYFCVRYLKGLAVTNKELNIDFPKSNSSRIPSHIAYAVEYLKEATSTLSHSNYDYFEWVSYSYKSCLYSLCEVWVWFGDLEKEKD